jgi:hypothetical protein
MRILFNDLIKSANISATNGSDNYPASNIAHPFLFKRFQTIATTSLITIAWSADVSVDSLFYGHHNISSMIVRLKDSGGVVLETVNVTSPTDRGKVYFSQVWDNVRRIELDITGPNPTKLGGVGCGVYYQNIDFLNDAPESGRRTGNFSKSPGGQSNNLYIKPLKTFAFSFRDRLTADKKIWLDLNDEYGRGPFWFDITEDNNEFLPVIYATIENYPGVARNGRRYDNALSIEESR